MLFADILEKEEAGHLLLCAVPVGICGLLPGDAVAGMRHASAGLTGFGIAEGTCASHAVRREE